MSLGSNQEVEVLKFEVAKGVADNPNQAAWVTGIIKNSCLSRKNSSNLSKKQKAAIAEL